MSQHFELLRPPQDEIEKRARVALKELTARQRRVVTLLLNQGECTTGFVANKCQCGNVSAVVISMQKHLREHGLFIRNFRPKTGLVNHFGEPSRAHVWELVGYKEAK